MLIFRLLGELLNRIWSDIFYRYDELSLNEAKSIVSDRENQYDFIFRYLDLIVLSDGQNVKALTWEKQALLWWRWRFGQFVWKYKTDVDLVYQNTDVAAIDLNSPKYKFRPAPIPWIQSRKFPLIPLLHLRPYDANYNIELKWLCFSFRTYNHFVIVKADLGIDTESIIVQVRFLYFTVEVYIGLGWIGRLLNSLFYRKNILDKKQMVDDGHYDRIVKIYGIECFKKTHHIGSYYIGTVWWRTLLLWIFRILDGILLLGCLRKRTYKIIYSK